MILLAHTSQWSRRTLAPASLALALFQSCSGEALAPPSTPPTEEERAATLARSEELILALTPSLNALGNALRQGGIVTPTTGEWFADTIEITPLAGKPDRANTIDLPLVEIIRQDWLISSATENLPRADFRIWQPFIATLGGATMESAGFHFVRGDFEGEDSGIFRTEVSFEGLAREVGGAVVSIDAQQQLTWTRTTPSATGNDRWQIAAWAQRSFETTRAPAPLFRELSETAIPDRQTYERAQRSYHEEHVIELFTKNRFQVQTTNRLYSKYTDIEGLFQHPALAVVDIDSDGRDDLYVMGRWGKNLLLHNLGDGTFEDIAPSIGLDVEAFCNCAIFADFDNDGDPDVFIGRSLERGLYLENQGGHFTDRSRDLVATPLPFLISSISAADYNGDGLLDVYLSLYGPSDRSHSVKSWAPDFFPPQMVAAMVEREPKSHTYIERLGPPNLLLVNRGGKFAIAPEAAQLAEWLNTFQCSWADYDDDGDQDAYVCNDFGPDHLYRNDGAASPGGQVVFTEVSKQLAGGAMQGFGMGASWGDYDGDGRLDLYVSNMYSKAGKRITAAFDGLDPRIPHSADGSLLFHNTGDRLEQVAGTEPPAMLVAKVGWSWGGQLVDLDNDGWPDIHAASGFYTAPEELRPQKDL